MMSNQEGGLRNGPSDSNTTAVLLDLINIMVVGELIMVLQNRKLITCIFPRRDTCVWVRNYKNEVIHFAN